MALPTDAKARKKIPLATGVMDYFPDALIEIASVSWDGNEQHNPGEPLHWAREKSKDHADCALRHFLERGKIDTDGRRHLAKAAWRILALLQLEIEAEREAGTNKDEAFTRPLRGPDGWVVTIPRLDNESWADYFQRMHAHPTGGWVPYVVADASCVSSPIA